MEYHSHRGMATPMLLVYATTFLVLLVALALRIKGKRGNVKLPPGSMGWPLLGETAAFLKPHPTNTTGTFIEDRLSRLETHTSMRAIATAFLSNDRVRSVFFRDADRLMIMLVNSWKENTVMYVKDEAIKYTLNIMAKNIFGMEPGLECEELGKQFEPLMNGFFSLPINLPGTIYSKALQSKKYILDFMRDKMEERIRKKRDGFGVTEDDYMGWVMEKTDYPPDCIGEMMLGMLFAGLDTTTKAIPLMLFVLHSSPSSTEQLRAKHLQIIRSKTQEDGWLTWDDYKKMEFTQCVINETLRLGNIVRFVQRKASTDFNFKGFDIPCGCMVTANFQALHQDPSLLEDPQVFHPWRWAHLAQKKKTNNFLAFGAGPRLCSRSELVRLEMAIFLYRLISSYNWELLEPKHPMNVPYIHFPDGLPMKIVKI